MNKIINLFNFVILLVYTSGSYATVNKQLQLLLDHFRINSQAPAVVLSIHFPNNKIQNFVSGNVEKKTLENPNPAKITIYNLFQIGSITKSFTAAIILQLEAEGKLSIKDTLADTVQKFGNWLPQRALKLWKNVTIQQLLNMTSGIFSITEDPHFNTAYLVKYPQKQWNPKEELEFVYPHPSYFPPGNGWHYSDTDYILLGMLIPAVTKHSVEYEMQHRLLDQASFHLKNTYYLPYSYPKNIMQRMAHGYAYRGDFSPPVKPGTDVTSINMSAANTAGAMVANTRNIIHWIQALFTGKILPKTQLKEMTTAVCMGSDNTCKPGQPLLLNSKSQGFGLGLSSMYDAELGKIWMYIGSTAGYYSSYVWLPKEKMILAMTVSSSSERSKKILKTLVDAAKLIYSKKMKYLKSVNSP